jgi:hypothetical protein
MQRNDIPAFPCGEQIRDSMIYQPEPGMTLRDYFAAKAMQGFITGVDDFDEDALAAASYRLADCMLRARGAA